jgi:hypothetical protein
VESLESSAMVRCNGKNVRAKDIFVRILCIFFYFTNPFNLEAPARACTLVYVCH